MLAAHHQSMILVTKCNNKSNRRIKDFLQDGQGLKNVQRIQNLNCNAENVNLKKVCLTQHKDGMGDTRGDFGECEWRGVSALGI